jgi:hypothetical protein
MLVFLPFSAYSISLLLTDSNVSGVYDIPKRSGLFIIFWGPSCQSCHHLRTNWDYFTESERYSPLIAFGEADCAVSPQFCSTFGTFDFPHAAYVELPSKQIFHYQGGFDSDEYSEFLDERLSLPIRFLPNASVPLQTNWSTFVLTYTDAKDSRFGDARRAFATVRDWGCSFFAVQGKKWQLEVHKSPTTKIPFAETWELSGLAQFVKMHAYPLICELTEDRIKHLSDHGLFTLVGVIVPAHFLTDLAHIAEYVESPWPVTYLAWSSDRLVARFRLGKDDLPAVFVFDPARERWIHYDGVLTDVLLSQWLKSVNLEEIRWSGVHESLGESLRELLWDSNPSFMVCVICASLYGTFRCWRERHIPKPQNRRPSDYEFTPL